MNNTLATVEENATKYEKIKEQNRIRQRRRYYEKNQEKILEKKKAQRDLFNENQRNLQRKYQLNHQ